MVDHDVADHEDPPSGKLCDLVLGWAHAVFPSGRLAAGAISLANGFGCVRSLPVDAVTAKRRAQSECILRIVCRHCIVVVCS